MKTRQQKRKEAADRLDRYAERIERGEIDRFTPNNYAVEAAARRAEATRLRKI